MLLWGLTFNAASGYHFNEFEKAIAGMKFGSINATATSIAGLLSQGNQTIEGDLSVVATQVGGFDGLTNIFGV